MLSASDAEALFRRELGSRVAANGGDDHVVDGMRPALVLRPASVEELRAASRLAGSAGLGLIPFGGGAHVHIGNVPARYDAALSLAELNRVLRHDAADMTVAVEAGITFDGLNDVLAGAGQWLPLDPPHPERVSIGGIIAADLNGPLRFSQGKVRDYIIGIRVVDADGALIRGGGQVVKNVAGYDLPKLMVGSHGTLGAIVEATFKIRPRPPRDVTVAQPEASLLSALERVRAIARVPVFAADVLNEAGSAAIGLEPRAHVLVRIAGESAEVDDLRSRLAPELSRAVELDAATRSRWRDLSLDGPGAASCRLAVLPSRLSELVASIEAERGKFEVGTILQAHANGVVRLRVDAAPAQALRFLQWLQFAARGFGGAAIIEQLAPEMKRGIDVWGPSSLAPLMRAVKSALDPRGTFSPGRFVAGI